jgi:organic radical activating enzyme
MQPAIATLLPQGLPAGHYALMEHFYTLQGEGHWAGTAAYFVRLGGCDVGCHWCDVKESWDAAAHPIVTAQAIADWAAHSGTQRVVVTGGEPLLHPLDMLTTELKQRNLLTHLETSGTQPLTGAWDWVCFSPKKFKAPLPAFYDAAHELKIIVYNRHDLQWAETHAARVRPGCQLFLQPEWGTPDAYTWIVDYVKQDPRWRLSLQTHKFLNIP